MGPEALDTGRGSALVVAMLVTAILALLGMSFLLLAETERRIAENEKRGAQVLYVAEAGLRAVKRWFDDPGDSVRFPAASVVDRTLRRILDESDPHNTGAAIPADGVLGSRPYYKQAVDGDGDGQDDLFDRPYRGATVDALLGTEEGPDLRIDDGTPAAATFLDQLTQTLVADRLVEPGGVFARISRIDVYAPPYERFASVFQRAGIATVAITVRIYQDDGDGTLEVLAERRLKAVLAEAPYRALGLQGPLQSCEDLSFVPRTGDDMTVRWGAITAREDIDVGVPEAVPIPQSLPRRPPSRPGGDALYPADPGDFTVFADDVVQDNPIDDPWFRILAGDSVAGLGSPSHTGAYQDYTNLIEDLGIAICPFYDYRVWKGIAQAGEPDVRYFAWSGSGDEFRENGRGSARSFRDITHGQAGVFFFDTRDGAAPEDTDSDGRFDNLTPDIRIASQDWSFSGFLFLNAESFQVDGVSGVAMDVRPPGEPFLDENDNGRYDAGEPFVNLDYSTATATDGRVQAFTTESAPVRDALGPPVAGAEVSFRGILYNSGRFEATGAGTFYGSVVATQGVTQSPDDGSAVTPTLIWDASLAGDWPPEDLAGVPRVVVVDWGVGP